MVRHWSTWSGWLFALTVVAIVGTSPAAQASPSDEGGSNLLLLVTEKLEYPSKDDTAVNYWWSNPEDPQWTETDRALDEVLGETDAAAMTPPSDVRISRIYRTPELSLDNAASLASLLGARRIVLGEVTYRPTTTPVLPGYEGLEVEGTLQVVDVTSSEPSVIRSLEVERSIFSRKHRAASVEQSDSSELAERARDRFVQVVGALLDRTVLAASGKIGIETEEPLLSFRNLSRGRALEQVVEFLDGLEEVDETRVRWASEGRIALEINPSKNDDLESVRYAARTLGNHQFDRMTLRRIEKEAEEGPSRLGFSVQLADNFDDPRRRDEGNDGR